MKKLDVIYAGWGDRFKLGQLAEEGREILFEYSPQALEKRIEFSPLRLPLSGNSFSDFPEHQLRLPGLISDALPDGWGLLLMDRLFRKQGRSAAQISPLDRLAFIGDKAMGALIFEPPESETLTSADVQLLGLAEEIRRVFDDDDSEVLLRKLAFMGGSPQGARPKVLVNFGRKSNRMSNSDESGGTPMMVKFPAQHEHKEVCAVEALYGRLASGSNIRVPASEYFDLKDDLSAFGIERFDRSERMRVPMHTAAGASHADFRIPQLDYTALLRLTQRMTRDSREVMHAFERCVFNVIFNNRDDHSKNFSFIMGKDNKWIFSPAYDLTFSEGPNGEHQMDVCGEARAPSRKHLLQLANANGIDERKAIQAIDRIATVAENLTDFVENLPIRVTTLRRIEKAIKINRARMK